MSEPISEYLPLFPLNTVVFPGEALNLHIYEARYRELVHDIGQGNRLFGIPPYIDQSVASVGTLMELLTIEQTHPDGSMDIRSRGISLFEVTDFVNPCPGKLYAGGLYQHREVENEEDVVQRQQLLALFAELFAVLGLNAGSLPLDNMPLSFALGHKAGLSLKQEFLLLTLQSEAERQDLLIQHLQRVIPMIDELERSKARIKLNGHFRSFDPLDF